MVRQVNRVLSYEEHKRVVDFVMILRTISKKQKDKKQQKIKPEKNKARNPTEPYLLCNFFKFINILSWSNES